jgi:orotate phosphoribosyltransferase
MNSISIPSDKETLRQLILKKAYFPGKVILSSGKESDFYIDARIVTLTPQGALLTAELMLDMINDLDITAIGGPTLGADPMIGALGVVSFQQGRALSTFIIRKEPKGHGKGNMIEGPRIMAGDRVVIIDDVATTGKAFVHSIDVMRAMEVEVVKCLCVVDRKEGASEAVTARGSVLESIFSIDDIHPSSSVSRA